MKYIKVDWFHKFENEPIVIYSELDKDRNEVRKIELYRNGKIGFASSTIEYNESRLSIEPLPELEQIEFDPQFKPIQISKEEFENVWLQYVKKDGYIEKD